MTDLKTNILTRDGLDVPEVGKVTDPLSLLDSATREEVLAHAKEIYFSMTYSDNRITATMDLPPLRKIENEILAYALYKVLSSNFSINFPNTNMTDINAGNSVNFTVVPAQNPEPPFRSVAVILDTEQRILKISGVPHVDGTDGYSELAFEWKRQSGKISESGNIDLKKINMYPATKKKALLATIHSRTEGSPGIDCIGRRIKPKLRRHLKPRWNKNHVIRVDLPDDDSKYMLYAATSGILNFRLERKGDPGTLQELDISDTVTIKGDVNYGVGDLGDLNDSESECLSNIVIQGNVKGVFTLQSNGFIHVNGSIEGQAVVAEDVETDLITGGCFVKAKQEIIASSVVNARAEATYIHVKKNSNGSKFLAHDLIKFDKNSTCLGLEIKTKKAELHQSTLSGVNRFVLGEELFEKAVNLKQTIDELKVKIKSAGPALKELATAILTHLVQFEDILRKNPTQAAPQFKKVLAAIKNILIPAFQKFGSIIGKDAVPLSYRLQSLFSAQKFSDGMLKKVDLMTSKITKYNKIQRGIAEIGKIIRQNKDKLKEVENSIRNDLCVEVINSRMLGVNSEIYVKCAKAEKRISQDEMEGGTFKIKYIVPDDAENLEDGELKRI